MIFKMMRGDLAVTLRLYGRVRESIVDGPGLRYVVFVQGCPHHCIGCHNTLSQPFGCGEVVETDDLIVDILKNRELLSGITLSGGEPFEQAGALAVLAKAARREGLTVWTYSGYTLETLLSDATPENQWLELLDETDVLVDGPFMLNLRTLDIPFVGSSNQRIIDLKAKKGV